MRMFPIIPIPIMLVICIILIIILGKNIKKNVIQVIIVFLLFFINLRIMLPTNKSNIATSDLDVLFVIDSTISMNALDYNGTNTRLSGVKKDCEYIIDELSGARFSVITFNNTAKILVPFTTDSTMANNSINTIYPVQELYAKGSSLNKPILEMEYLLEEDLKKDDNKNIVVFFISDGENTSETPLSSYKDLRKYISGGAVLGYGTTKGAYMKQYNSTYKEERYIEYKFKKAVSKIDESNLKKMAKDMDIDYIHMDKQSNIDSKLKSLKNNSSTSLKSVSKSSYKDTYYIFVIPLLILLIINFDKYKRRVL